MTRRHVIAIDLDDVLGNERDAVREFVNQHKGLALTKADYSVVGEYWGYWEFVWGVEREEGKQIYEAYAASGAKYNHQPLEGALEAITKLKQQYKLVIITARGEDHMVATRSWLTKHFADAFSDVEFMPLWGDRHVISKAHIAGHHGASYLIDDNYEHCKIAAEAGIQALLFGDYGWNRQAAPAKGVTRVADWQAVLEYFDGKATR